MIDGRRNTRGVEIVELTDTGERLVHPRIPEKRPGACAEDARAAKPG
jgi:hypothetical protein